MEKIIYQDGQMIIATGIRGIVIKSLRNDGAEIQVDGEHPFGLNVNLGKRAYAELHQGGMAVSPYTAEQLKKIRHENCVRAGYVSR